MNNGWTSEIARLQDGMKQVRPLDPIYASEQLLLQGFVVVTKEQWSSTHNQLEQARDIATKAVQARIADAEKITRLESELADLRGMIEALQDENKKLKSIAAESIDDAVRAEEENRDLKIRYETIVGDHASALRFIKSIKAELAEVREKYDDLIMCVEKKYPGETRHETAISNV